MVGLPVPSSQRGVWVRPMMTTEWRLFPTVSSARSTSSREANAPPNQSSRAARSTSRAAGPSTRRALDLALVQITSHDLIFNRWGLGERHPTGLALAFNFAGPSGTGKTICAEAIAHALGRRLLVVRYAEAGVDVVGETPKNVAAVFRMAREQRAVLFFDEADAIASRRNLIRARVRARGQPRRQRAAPGTGVLSRRRDFCDEPRGQLRPGVRAADPHARALRDARRGSSARRSGACSCIRR